MIAYSNFGSKENKEAPKEKIQNQKINEVEKNKEKHEFEPLEIMMSIGLMALTLVLI